MSTINALVALSGETSRIPRPERKRHKPVAIVQVCPHCCLAHNPMQACYVAALQAKQRLLVLMGQASYCGTCGKPVTLLSHYRKNSTKLSDFERYEMFDLDGNDHRKDCEGEVCIGMRQDEAGALQDMIKKQKQAKPSPEAQTEMIDVSNRSSNIDAISTTTPTLIRFKNGSTYRFDTITAEEHTDFLNVKEHAGTYFIKHFRDRPSVKIS